ncbi:MAG TPA: HIRAN protein [Gammaproteobacteria bacterium]|uniref:HIRAN domain-containing protein n=2 Tax=Immundisolibacter sp. TaxID=1934948 RepID=UPI000E8A9FA1|nr:HIRAN protein [Gammaproteobacteria bacterium]MCH78943.1 HIRAN protein [Gammaproteobacteria bacterium]
MLSSVLNWLARRLRQRPELIPPLELPLAGFRHHRATGVWPFLHPGAVVELKREPWNRHDSRAVAVYYRRDKLGYLPRSDNFTVARWLDQGRALSACIARLDEAAPSARRLLLRLELQQVSAGR